MLLCAAPAEPAVLAVQAMREESLSVPNPVLSTVLTGGAHSDMDLPLFLKSAGAIAPFLEEMAQLTPRADSSDKVLPLIRPVGVRAEAAMFKATAGVNTHKGQIFLLGVCTAAAVRTGGGSRETLEEAGRICRGITGGTGKSRR